MALRIVIADSSDFGSDSMEKFLRENFDCELIHKTNKGPDLLYLLQHNSFDLVIADTDLEDMPAFEVCRQLVKSNISVPVIGLGMTDEFFHCRSMLDAGGRGFIMRNVGYAELRRCIDAVCAGTTYICARCHHLLSTRVQNKTELNDEGREVLSKVVEEKNSDLIGEELFTSKGKVKRIRQYIIKVAKTRSPFGIVMWAIYHGYIRLKYAAGGRG